MLQAEAVFAELKKHPDACAQHLVRSLRHSPSLEARGLCAVLLRKVRLRLAALLPFRPPTPLGLATADGWPCRCPGSIWWPRVQPL